jgi:hypothetical protein
MGINDTRNPGIGATNDENSVFHSPKYTNGQKLMGCGGFSKAFLVGLVLAAIFSKTFLLLLKMVQENLRILIMSQEHLQLIFYISLINFCHG